MVKESNKGHRICGITPGSIAEEMGVEPGDFLCAVNGQEIKDIFDYNFLMADEYVEILIRTADGQECVLEVEKEEEETPSEENAEGGATQADNSAEEQPQE